MMNLRRLATWHFLVLTLGLAACGPAPTPSPTPTQTPNPPTATATATATRRPLPTLAPTQTPSPIPTATITPGPSPTSTRQPPVESHQWQPGRVLLKFGVGDRMPTSPFGSEPELTLYADGLLIARLCQAERCSYGSRQMKREQVCSVLNTIDSLGFFDYDPDTYRSPQTGDRTVSIEVNAWRSKRVRLDQLDRWLEDPLYFVNIFGCKSCFQRPTILPALANTYYFLSHFRPEGLKPYQPERIGLWLSRPFLVGTPSPWPLASPSLTDLYERSKCADPNQSQVVPLSGSDAIRVSEAISKALAKWKAPLFTEGDLQLQVVNQWLLPDEGTAGCGETENPLPAAGLPTPAFILNCSPADGILPVPTLTPTPFP